MSTFVGFASSTVAYAALGNPFGSSNNKNGIYKSTTANSCNMSFTQETGATLPALSTVGRIDMGISPNFATDNTVYASIADAGTASNTNLGVWVTKDGGTTWTLTAAPDVCQQQCWYDNVVKVDPTSGAHAFFGGGAVTSASGAPIYVVRTADTGATFQSIIPNINGGPGIPHVDIHAMAFLKQSNAKILMYLGNDGGIWKTLDAEATPVAWIDLNQSALTLTQFYPAISIHPSTPNLGFAGAQDNGSQIYTGPSTTWTDNNTCGDGTGTAIDSIIPSTVYVACNGLNLNFSVLNGAPNSYTFSDNGIIVTDNADFVPPLVSDPNNANRAYVGSSKVYQSLDNGNSYTPISPDLVNANGNTQDNLTAIAVAPQNSSVIYAGATNGQVFVATNVTTGSASFALVGGQGSLPPRRVSAVEVDPGSVTGLTAYAAFSGFSFVAGGVNDPIGHLFQTKDGGATWTDVSCTVANCSTPALTDLPNTPVNDVVVDPDVAGVLYAATDVGVFQGVCATTGTTTCTWTPLGSGLPRVAVLSLKLHHASRTLSAATHGRGVWQTALTNFTFPGPHIATLSQVSANAPGSQFSLTITGNGLNAGTAQWTVGTTQTPLSTTSATATQVVATVPANLLAGSALAQVTVSVAGSSSNKLPFTVLGGAPTSITSVAPASAPVNSLATPITVNGTGFSNSTQVVMDPDVGGTPIPTTFVSATQVSATIPAGFQASFGSTNSVGVRTPPPGGGEITSANQALPVFVVIAPAPANDNLASAAGVNLAGSTFTDTKDSSGATVQSGEQAPACAVPVTGNPNPGLFNTIWYKFTANNTATLEADTIGSSYDSVLATYTSSSPSNPTLASLTAVSGGCNDDIVPGVITQSQVSFTATAGTTYFFQVGSFGIGDPNPVAFGGKSIFNLNFTQANNPVPTVTTLSPTNTNAGSAQFTLTVNGSNFVNGAVVNFGAAAEATTFVSSSQLTATILATDVATAGNVGVTVTNPAPGGGTSTPAVNFTVNSVAPNPVPTVTSINPTSATAGGAAFTLTVNGTNFVKGASSVNFGTNTPTTTFVSATQLTAAVTAAQIATTGNVGVTVTNAPPGGGTSTPAVNFTVNPAPTFSVAAGNSTVTTAAGAAGSISTGTSAITLTPKNGFSAAVAITCGSLPGVTCSALTIPAGSTSGSLTINVLNPSSSMMASLVPDSQNMWASKTPPNGGAKGWWMLSGGTGLAALVLLILPGRKRYRAALGLGLVCLLSFTLGCGGGSTVVTPPTPTATTTQLTVSATKVASTGMITVSATVTGGTPTGMVQFFVDGAAAGNAVALTNGSTGNIMATAANVPTLFQLVGTHTLSAHYLGSTSTAASQSGTLNIAVTGTTQLAITGTSGSTTANGNVSLTIN